LSVQRSYICQWAGKERLFTCIDRIRALIWPSHHPTKNRWKKDYNQLNSWISYITPNIH
jgi:hypothetical protein